MQRYVGSHQLIQQNRRKKWAYIYNFWQRGLLPINLQISPTKSSRLCKNKSIYNPRRKNYLPFSEISSFKRLTIMNGKRERAVWWTIGICNSAEICELVGLFVLYKFQQLNKIHNFGLNRDDELAVVNNMSGPQSQKIKKELHFLFKKFGLNLIIIYPVTFFYIQ